MHTGSPTTENGCFADGVPSDSCAAAPSPTTLPAPLPTVTFDHLNLPESESESESEPKLKTSQNLPNPQIRKSQNWNKS